MPIHSHSLIRRSRKELYLSAKTWSISESQPKFRRRVVCWFVKTVGKPDAGKPHVRFDEGETWKRSRVGLVRHRQTKGPATDRPHLHHRATSLLYQPNSTCRISHDFRLARFCHFSRLISFASRRDVAEIGCRQHQSLQTVRMLHAN